MKGHWAPAWNVVIEWFGGRRLRSTCGRVGSSLEAALRCTSTPYAHTKPHMLLKLERVGGIEAHELKPEGGRRLNPATSFIQFD